MSEKDTIFFWPVLMMESDNLRLSRVGQFVSALVSVSSVLDPLLRCAFYD